MRDQGEDDDLLQQQIAYYRARAAEYHEWHERRGRYDMGTEHTERWIGEVDRVAEALEQLEPFGRVVELAAGTGWWSERLARRAAGLLVVDAAPETLALNRLRCEPIASARGISYRQQLADLFDWRPDQTFDLVFFSFWLSHVPATRENAFWELVNALLAPRGRFFFIDSARSPESIPADHRLPEGPSDLALRRLNDGTAYRVIKRFFDPLALEAELGERGFHARVRSSGELFIYGEGSPR
ncbi:MAG: class I SAM-dependent methyltransferase [Myxococcales bacterium]|nr:class I SAM-dependent methyltransferase [Myxococcales bacterium]